MEEKNFAELARKRVAEYHNKHLVPVYRYSAVLPEDVYIVWMVKVLQNNKAMLSTPVRDDMYYEFTWDGDKNCGYLDAYRKSENRVVRNQ